MRPILTLAAVALLATPATAQDTFVPLGLKSTCEWLSGSTCVRAGAPRRRPRSRIVHVPVTTYKAYRHVPEHLAPIHRKPEVRGWKRHHRDPFPRCWPVSYRAYSDEKVIRDAKGEAQRRWSGMVRAELGERYMDHQHAVVIVSECWQSSTGERIIDKATGGNERCVYEARPCRAEKPRTGDDE